MFQRFMEKQWTMENERIIYTFYIFQCASCYLVFFIAILRLGIVRNPMKFEAFQKKITNWSCSLIWFLVVVLNTTYSFMPPSKALKYIRLHFGVTLPIFLSIITSIYFRIYLEKSAFTRKNYLTKKEQKNKTSLQNLINGLVIWLIVCNVPFIGWFHYATNCYTSTKGKTPWIGISGVRYNW